MSKVTSQVSQTLKSFNRSGNMKIIADFCHTNFREAEGLEAIFGWVGHGCHGEQEMKIGGSQDAVLISRQITCSNICVIKSRNDSSNLAKKENWERKEITSWRGLCRFEDHLLCIS